MKHDTEFGEMGQELGRDGVERLVDHFEEIRAQERRRIELANEGPIAGLQAEIAMWAEEDNWIGDQLRLASPLGNKRSRRINAWFAGIVVLVLTVAEFFFSLLAFDPFRFGWKSYLYCIGIAVVSPFCIEKCLQEWNCRSVLKGLALAAGLAALTSLVLLAVVRADLFAHAIKDMVAQAVVIDGSQPTPQNSDNFYGEAIPVLRLTMAFLALAMALGSGLALHDVKRCAIDSETDADSLAQRRRAVRQQMAWLLARRIDLSNEGAIFDARVQRDFHRSLLTHAVRKSLGKLLVVGICVSLPASRSARASQQPLNLVVAIDLSASVASKGPDGTTDFEKNVAAVTRLLGAIPAGSCVTVIGITSTSFAEPDILLSAKMPSDGGYFGERLVAAHQQLVRAWQVRAARLDPNFRRTDILGALLVAAQLFEQAPTPNRKILVIYSDMRQDTPEFYLNKSVSSVTLQKAVKAFSSVGLLGVDVYAVGVDASGSNIDGWDALKQFWAAYLNHMGANLKQYSVLRDAPRF
jgi:hypothetical protein